MKKLYFLLFTILIGSTSFGQDLVISGVYDGPLPGGIPKGVELRVLADIADLSAYGIGSANNGGGSDGEEFTFPAVAAAAGDYIYVASEVPQFTAFFGFAPDYTTGVMGINGDDAIELFENGTVIDTFGDINTDGTGQPWEYLDGWAYRVNDSGPDGGTFNISNWSFSGINALDGESDNASAATPFPIGTYTNSVLSTDGFSSIKFSVFPNPTPTGTVNITSANSSIIDVAVFDVLGKQVKKQTISNNVLNVSDLKSGIYLLQITQDNATSTKKLVIR